MVSIHELAAEAALSAFGIGAQNKRLLRLTFPKKDGPHALLLPNRLHAHEELSRGYRFEVEVLSDDASIPLKAMMARMVTISLVHAGGSLRYFNGYVTEFRFIRADGGFAFYQMVLEPFLAFARLRQDNVSFHGKTMRQITEDTLAHYRQADWHMFTHEDDPVLTAANQHNETDYNHLHRRWEARGMLYWYEHRADGHTLMLSDDSRLAGPIDADRHYDADVIAYHAESGSVEDDGIHRWSPVRRLGSGFTTLASFDYKNPDPQFVEWQSPNQQGDFFAHEIYENTGAYGFQMRSEGENLAQQRMAERDKDTQTFEAEGNDRTVQPGRVFKLGGHFSADPRSLAYDPEPRGTIGNRDYLILSVDHEASNNYQAGAGAPSHYKNSFTCMRSAIRWRPGRDYHSTPCANPGVQTAIVVGPAGEEIHTDGLGRVKVQFHWDRLGKRDENSSAWIRVMAPGAGGEFGYIRLPRVGEEVVVVYPDGNIDHPLIIGGVYNATHTPPWALPGQHALSGLRSRELGGGDRSNHLVLDDTAGKIQAQIKSDHACSQLSLGHITRIEDTAGRKDMRGEGWELATNAWGVARAAQGLLITTEARPNATSHVKDLNETARRLEVAAQIHEQLAKMAVSHEAQESGQQSDAADDVNAQNSAVRGTAKQAFPGLAEPHLIVASPAGIELTSAQSMHIASSRHTAITSGKSLSIASAEGLFASVAKTFRLFVHQAGMKLVAAGGKVSVQAQSDDIEIIANKVLELFSETDWVTIRGKKGVRLQGGDNMVEVGEQVQFFTSSPVLFHGNLETLPSKSASQSFNERKSDYRFDQEVNFVNVNTRPEKNIAYELLRSDGAVFDGKTAASGSTELQKSAGLDSYTIRYKGELP
jgi:type VI secretion system secreted protein VgrG